MHLLLEINRLKAEILVKDTEIEALKMGFVGNGIADSELAETRAMANRMSLTIKKQAQEIEALKQIQLALQKLSDISQEIEDRDSAIYATGYWNGIEYKRMRELTDEEILKIASQYLTAHAQFIGAGECHYEGEIEFARALLKKAGERA